MKEITQFQGDDGKVYKSEEEALAADIVYWKGLGQKWLDHLKAQEEYRKRNPDPDTSYSRGHQ